jgi:hypothetical protein
MLRMSSNLSGPVPRGLRLTFVVLTVGTLALAVAAAVKGVWLLVVIAGVFAVCNLGILWTTRTPGGSAEASGLTGTAGEPTDTAAPESAPSDQA